MTNRLRICLAASGGGHVRQLLDLRAAYAEHDIFFVTEDTALGRTLAHDERVHFLPHFAFGQVKQRAPFKMMAGAIRSLLRSAAVIWRERPDVVISTGAGAVFFVVLWARLFGACIIAVESFARFRQPSLFGRLAAPLAHHFVVQSEALREIYPKAHVFDPLRRLDTPPPAKESLLFATVGATLPFPRLVEAVIALKASGDIVETVVLQTGAAVSAHPEMTVVESLPFDEVKSLLRRASIVVCHGGTGSIVTALQQGCAVIAMARKPEFSEHYDDHQSEITQALEERGLLLVAESAKDLGVRLVEARARPPVVATLDPQGLIAFLRMLFQKTPRERKTPISPVQAQHAPPVSETPLGQPVQI